MLEVIGKNELAKRMEYVQYAPIRVLEMLEPVDKILRGALVGFVDLIKNPREFFPTFRYMFRIFRRRG